MGKGRTYENTLVNELERGTDSPVNVYPVGYSGSHDANASDILITDGRTGLNHAIELKKRGGDYCRFDSEELAALAERANAHTNVYLVVSFNNREVMVVRYFEELTEGQHPDAAEYNDMTVPEKFAVLAPDSFDPRVTDSGKLALTKPSTDDWPSAQAGSSDVDAICSGIGLMTEKTLSVK